MYVSLCHVCSCVMSMVLNNKQTCKNLLPDWLQLLTVWVALALDAVIWVSPISP